jgi:serine/threonine protein phosphatase PrpC
MRIPPWLVDGEVSPPRAVASPPRAVAMPVADKPWGVSQQQKRAHEDRYQTGRIGPFRYFAVFDGHGGARQMGPSHVAETCVERLHTYLENALAGANFNNENEVKARITTAFPGFDRFMYNDNKRFGTTCTMLLIDDARHKFYQVNLGDSRSIVFNGGIRAETIDQEPNNPTERERIENAGGIVRGNRVDGMLAVARAFGDFELKRNNRIKYDPIYGKVSAVPVVTVTTYLPGENLKFILTSDAPFEGDAFNNETLVALARTELAKNPGNYNEVAHQMVQTVAARTTDDTTILIGEI